MTFAPWIHETYSGQGKRAHIPRGLQVGTGHLTLPPATEYTTTGLEFSSARWSGSEGNRHRAGRWTSITKALHGPVRGIRSLIHHRNPSSARTVGVGGPARSIPEPDLQLRCGTPGLQSLSTQESHSKLGYSFHRSSISMALHISVSISTSIGASTHTHMACYIMAGYMNMSEGKS